LVAHFFKNIIFFSLAKWEHGWYAISKVKIIKEN